MKVKTALKNKPVILIIMFLLLQLGGQTAAGFSARAEGFFNLFTLISYCALCLRGLLWILILKVLPLTTAYPLTGTVYFLILPLSVFIFGESPDWSRFAGAALIFAGIIFSAYGSAADER